MPLPQSCVMPLHAPAFSVPSYELYDHWRHFLTEMSTSFHPSGARNSENFGCSRKKSIGTRPSWAASMSCSWSRCTNVLNKKSMWAWEKMGPYRASCFHVFFKQKLQSEDDWAWRIIHNYPVPLFPDLIRHWLINTALHEGHDAPLSHTGGSLEGT